MKEQRERTRLSRYAPNPGFQNKFFRSRAKVRLGIAGNQSGKTHMGAVEVALLALGMHPHKKVKTPNTSAVVSAASLKEGIEKIVLPKILEVVGSEDIVKIRRNAQGLPTTIIWRNGSITHLMSAEQEDIVFEGITLDFFWIDEPVRRTIFIALKRGLMKTGGLAWMTCTPLDEPWIYEELYLPWQEGRDKEIDVFEGSTDDNQHLTEEGKAEFKKYLSADEIDARWHGKFRHLSGRVFKEYRTDETGQYKNRVPSFDVPYHWPVWVAIDPHRNKPNMVVFIAVSPYGVKYICNEIFLSCTPDVLAETILDLEEQYNVVERLIDTSAQEDGWGKVSCRQMLQEGGVRTKLAQKKNKKASGITLMNQSLKDGTLQVMEHCKRVHKELTNQVYKKNKRDPQNKLEEPEKKWDDATDCIRYILVENPRYTGVARVKEQEDLFKRVR